MANQQAKKGMFHELCMSSVVNFLC